MIKILLFLGIFLFGDQILSQPSGILKNAHCEEITGPDGKIYSTFGEGPCPYGSKKTYGQKIYCPPGNVHRSYECASRKLDQINNTFDGLREGVVAIGQAIGNKIAREHNERMAKHNEMVVKDSYKSIENEDKYKKFILNEPEGQDIYIQKVGIPLISKKGGYYSDCVVPHFDYEKSFMGMWTYYILKDQPICKLKKYSKYINEKIYYPAYWNGITVPSNPNPPASSGYKVSERKEKYTICQYSLGMSGLCVRKKSSEDLSHKIGFVTDNDLPYAHIVYLGKFGDIFKFNLISNNEESEFYLANSGKVIDFKGAKLEIISLNENFAEYRIINYFN